MSVTDIASKRKPEPSRGRLLTADEVAKVIFREKVSSRWVRLNVPGGKLLSPRKLMWFEDDVWSWLREQGAA